MSKPPVETSARSDLIQLQPAVSVERRALLLKVASAVRDGRYEDFDKAADGDQVKHKYGKLISMYSEKAATTKSAITGKSFYGMAKFFPPVLDCADQPIDNTGYDMKLITHREITMTKSRTAGNYWLTSILPENALLMNKRDADAKGLKDGDVVRVVAGSNPDGKWDLGNGNTAPLEIAVRVIQGIRLGTVTFALGYGHWAYGARTITVDGEELKADPRRAKGTHLNAAMQIDSVLKNTSLADPVGASVAFYDTMVKVIKV